MTFSQHNSPLEQEEVDVIVTLGEEVSQHPGRITTADLIGRQSKVDALDKVPHLSHDVLAEAPARSGEDPRRLPKCTVEAPLQKKKKRER